MSNIVRNPAVAGSFYPRAASKLHNAVQTYLQKASVAADMVPPKAIIAPHAGYIYSGPIAASAYACLKPIAERIKRVVLLGPVHRVPIRGLATSSYQYFSTPLGNVPLDTDSIEHVLALPQVAVNDDAHLLEHSLEVHLPFLQILFSDFTLVPLVVGDATPEDVGEVLQTLWGGEETLIIISSDLCHYHLYETARQRDRQTSNAIEKLRYEDLDYEDACGCKPVSGLLWVCRQQDLQVTTLDLRNSGDTAGSGDLVVGYGAYLVH